MALDFVAGCLGGCAGVVVGHPFDTIKVKLQTQDYRNPVYRGAWDCCAKLLRTESVAGLYRGVSSPMAGVAVVNAIVFGIYGNVQRNMTEPDSLRSHFMAGAIAGLFQSVVASPVELVKTRVQTSNQYRSSMDCFTKICCQEGVRGVFKGLSITGIREFFGYGLYFATYEALTRTSTAEVPVGLLSMLLAGGLSGTVSWVFTYPIDVIKSRYQADIGKCTSITDCIRKSFCEEGVMFLTRGLFPTIMRAFPTNAVTFTVVTWVFRLEDLEPVMSGDIKISVDSILERLSKSQTKNLALFEGSISDANFNWFLGKLPQQYFLKLEDLWTSVGCDEYLEESVQDISSMKLQRPQRNQQERDNVSDIVVSSAGMKKTNAPSREDELKEYDFNKTFLLEDEFKNITR